MSFFTKVPSYPQPKKMKKEKKRKDKLFLIVLFLIQQQMSNQKPLIGVWTRNLNFFF